jgi:hypothetical protein
MNTSTYSTANAGNDRTERRTRAHDEAIEIPAFRATSSRLAAFKGTIDGIVYVKRLRERYWPPTLHRQVSVVQHLRRIEFDLDHQLSELLQEGHFVILLAEIQKRFGKTEQKIGASGSHLVRPKTRSA